MSDPVGRYLSFDSVASEYDATRVIPEGVRAQIAQLCAREAGLKRGGLFLDAGVGTGRFALPLMRLHPGQIVGVDVSRAMMDQLCAKLPDQTIPLVQTDLQRLPFRSGVFQGALVVHILHLIERWPLVLEELRRVLVPRRGVLLLGVEQGGRSLLVDRYFELARSRRVLAPSMGTPGLTQAVGYLRRRQAQVSQASTKALAWKRVLPIQETLATLSRRSYSQMWSVPESDHLAIMAELEAEARRMAERLETTETLPARFVLYRVQWLS